MRKVLPYLAATILLMAVIAAPASAHSELLSMTPLQNSTATTAPTKVVLTFSEKISPAGEGLTVTGPDGIRVDNDVPKAKNNVLSVALGPILLNGHYIVNYRVVSADGHPVEASAGFEILIPALTATATAKILVNTENENGIDKGEGRSAGEKNLTIGLYLIAGVILGGGALFWYRRRQSKS